MEEKAVGDPVPEGDNFKLKIVAIVLVTMLIVTVLTFEFRDQQSGPSKIELEVGDSFYYSSVFYMNGSVGHGNTSILITSFGSTTHRSLDLAVFGSVSSHIDIFPVMQDNDLGYTYLENREIETPFGMKGVSTFAREVSIWPEQSPDYHFYFMEIIDIGIDSELVYRMTLTNADVTVTTVLNDTNKIAVWDADKDAYRSDVSDDILNASDVPNLTMYQAANNMTLWGIVDIDEGDAISYNVTNATASVFFISFDQLGAIQQGNFTYEMTMSSTSFTEKEVEGVPGHYIFWIIVYEGGQDEFMKISWL